jgi:hypothetical protein
MKRYACVSAALAIMMLSASIATAQRSRESVAAAEVNGIFEMGHRGRFKDMSNSIRILALGAGKLRIAIDALYPYLLPNGELMANTGALDEIAKINGDTAIYRSDDSADCVTTLKFVRAGILEVAQDGTCGFGQRQRFGCL